ncbi:Maf family protein [Flocculibacter collagenilyticus]|uniref:Maf family protein n=1 Tax=Flocculibacter collagenilyticus TaxID=2744479 RepID=UPI0018F75C81|nr:Maf family protein [Flocculibacter collagenilyticus]
MQPAIILASTSPYRKALLEKFAIKFKTEQPDVEEIGQPNESAQHFVKRMSIEKARNVALRHQQEATLVIGSDQIAVFNDNAIGKPYTHEKAVKQLTMFSGQQVTFLTAITVINCITQQKITEVEPFTVKFRTLLEGEINNYLLKEKPYHCAGSFMCEGLGISLFEKLIGDDPNALIGLPLIRLNHILQQFDFNVLLNKPDEY